MGKKRVLVSYGVDVDAVAGWLGSYGGEDSSNDISRGELSNPRLALGLYLIRDQATLPGQLARKGC